MRAILIGLAVLVILAVGAIVVGPSLIPASVYRDQITAAVVKATGRTFTINGPVSLKVFPSVKASVEQASLGNAEGGEAKSLADVGRLDVGLALWPLLSRRAEITSFVLNDAVIHLEVAKDGTQNWDFKKTKDETGADESAAEKEAAKGSQVSEVSLGDVRLNNGQVTYKNFQTGDAYELSSINSKIELPGLDQPLKLSGDAIYKAQKLNVTMEVEKPRAAMDGGTTAVKVKLDGAPLNANFDGTVTFGEKAQFAGDTSLDVPSVRRLSAWLGNPMTGDKGFGHMSIAGKVSFAGDDFAFKDADLRFDEIHATGNVTGKLGGKVPYINASLATDSLDLRPYIEESGKSADAGGGAGGSSAKSSAGWSTEPIDASALKAFNGDIAFDAGKIFVRDLTIDKSTLAAKIQSGVLTVNLTEIALYGGAAKGVITVDGSKKATQIASTLALSGLDLARFMKDAAKTQKLEGTGAFNIKVNGSGVSQRDLVSSLAGTAAIDFKNGAIKGVDLVKIAGVVNTLMGKPKATAAAAPAEGTDAQGATTVGQDDTDKTKFVKMGGTFAIASGVANTSDFKMINELVSLSGRGSINLVQQSIDMRVDPGQNQNDGGLKVALLVKGPLAKPKITPDVSALVQNELGKALDKLFKPKAKEMSGETGATEGAPADGTAPADGAAAPKDKTEQQVETAKELLKGLFGK